MHAPLATRAAFFLLLASCFLLAEAGWFDAPVKTSSSETGIETPVKGALPELSHQGSGGLLGRKGAVVDGTGGSGVGELGRGEKGAKGGTLESSQLEKSGVSESAPNNLEEVDGDSEERPPLFGNMQPGLEDPVSATNQGLKGRVKKGAAGLNNVLLKSTREGLKDTEGEGFSEGLNVTGVGAALSSVLKKNGTDSKGGGMAAWLTGKLFQKEAGGELELEEKGELEDDASGPDDALNEKEVLPDTAKDGLSKSGLRQSGLRNETVAKEEGKGGNTWGWFAKPKTGTKNVSAGGLKEEGLEDSEEEGLAAGESEDGLAGEREESVESFEEEEELEGEETENGYAGEKRGGVERVEEEEELEGEEIEDEDAVEGKERLKGFQHKELEGDESGMGFAGEGIDREGAGEVEERVNVFSDPGGVVSDVMTKPAGKGSFGGGKGEEKLPRGSSPGINSQKTKARLVGVGALTENATTSAGEVRNGSAVENGSVSERTAPKKRKSVWSRLIGAGPDSDEDSEDEGATSAAGATSAVDSVADVHPKVRRLGNRTESALAAKTVSKSEGVLAGKKRGVSGRLPGRGNESGGKNSSEEGVLETGRSALPLPEGVFLRKEASNDSVAGRSEKRPSVWGRLTGSQTANVDTETEPVDQEAESVIRDGGKSKTSRFFSGVTQNSTLENQTSTATVAPTKKQKSVWGRLVGGAEPESEEIEELEEGFESQEGVSEPETGLRSRVNVTASRGTEIQDEDEGGDEEEWEDEGLVKSEGTVKEEVMGGVKSQEVKSGRGKWGTRGSRNATVAGERFAGVPETDEGRILPRGNGTNLVADAKEARASLMNNISRVHAHREPFYTFDNETSANQTLTGGLDTANRTVNPTANVTRVHAHREGLEPYYRFEDELPVNGSLTEGLTGDMTGGVKETFVESSKGGVEYAGDETPFGFNLDAVHKQAKEHLVPHVQALSEATSGAFDSTHKQIRTSLDGVVGPKASGVAATAVLLLLLLVPGSAVWVICRKIRAVFSLQTVLFSFSAYFLSHSLVLLLTALTYREPLALFQRNFPAAYVMLQFLTLLGYVIFLALCAVSFAAAVGTGEMGQRALAVAQLLPPLVVGLHYLGVVWGPAMVDAPPHVGLLSYAAYTLAFACVCGVTWFRRTRSEVVASGGSAYKQL